MILLVNLIFIAVGNYFYSIIMDFNKKNLYTQARYKQEIQELKINNQELEKLKAEGLLLDSAFAYKINAKLKYSQDVLDPIFCSEFSSETFCRYFLAFNLYFYIVV